MSRAINATTTIAYVAETVPGVTPATPAFKLFRATGENLDVEADYADTTELNGFRGATSGVPVRRGGSGSVDFDLTALTLEDFIEAALRTTWATNVATAGNTDKSFTVETKFETGGTDIYKRLVGARVDTLSLKCDPAAKVTGQVGFVAMDGSFATSIVTGATYTAGNAEPVQVGANVGAPTFTGLTFGVCAGLEFNINNSASPLYTLNGSLAATDVTVGDLEVSGTATFILDSTEANILAASLAGTESGLTTTIGITAAKRLTISIPRLVFKNPKVVSSSTEGDTVLTVDWMALQASSISSSLIRVTRAV